MRRDDPEPKTRWGPMVLASVAVHALVIGGVVILASGSAPPRLLYAPSMSVGLVSPGEVGLPPGGGGDPSVPPNTDRPSGKSAPKTKVKAPAESPRPKVEKPKPEITRALSLKPEPRAKRPKPKTAKPPKAVVRVPKKAPRKQPPKKKRAAAPRGDAPPKKVKKKRRTETPAVSAKTRRKPAAGKLAGKELDALDRIRKRLLARASRPAGRRGGAETRRRGGGPGKPGGGGYSGPGGRDSYKNELARIFYAAWVLPRSIPTEGLKVDLIIHIDRGGRIVKTDIKVQGLRFDPKFHRGFTP